MNYFKCCLDCVAPKRYPGCSAKCEEYLSERAQYDLDKEKANEVDRGAVGNYFMERRVKSQDRYVKYKQKKHGRKSYSFGEK
jgi:hypothetical protein